MFLIIYKKNMELNILKNRYIYISVAWILFITSVILIFFVKLNLWIDMTGWIQTEYSFTKELNLDNIRTELTKEAEKITFNNSKVINEVSAYFVTWEKQLVVVTWLDNSINDVELAKIKITYKENLLKLLQKSDETIKETGYNNIWKSFWDYIKNTAFTTLAIAILGIAIYIVYAFSWSIWWISSWSFWLITIVTLFHDVIVSTWAYIFISMFFPEFKIDTFFVTALLTILWYSISDTIVVFDRIRSNLKIFGWRKWKDWKDLYEIVNLSINETFVRSIYTSFTLFLVLLAVLFFGPETIKWFILVMLFWVIFGTYSSIFIASPILYIVNQNKTLSVYKKIEIKPEDKIVV